MLIAENDPKRKQGLVWQDKMVAKRPATHVMIIGVGKFQSAQLPQPLTSTTISARAIADWFAGAGDAGFKNPDLPLGSLALLLSEPAVGDARYAEGPVPRATTGETETALNAWLDRLETNKENFAVLYVASHGESYLGKTVFLLEDYDTRSRQATWGTVQAEQLVASMANAMPTRQLLLFDCCRTPSTAKLPIGQDAGTPLITLTKREDDHGEDRQQCVITSTLLDRVALGRAEGTTVFTDALIHALNGAGRDVSIQNWPVRSGSLCGKVTDLMSLHRLPDEEPQKATDRSAGNFDICLPGKDGNIPVFIAMKDPADWQGSRLTLSAGGQSVVLDAASNEPPFHEVTYPAMTELVVTAERNALPVGNATVNVYPPAQIVRLEREPPPAANVVGRLEPGRSLTPRAQLRVQLNGYAQVEAGAVAEIVRADDPARNPKRITVPLAGNVDVDVRPGAYNVTLWTPDGDVHRRHVTVQADDILGVAFSMPSSPHEWLTTAATTGAVKPFTLQREYAQAQSSDGTGTADGPPPVALAVMGHLDGRLTPSAASLPLRIGGRLDDGRLVRVDLVEQTSSYFRLRSAKGKPIFARIALQDRLELCVAPSVGATRSGWNPYLLVDRLADPRETATTVVVEDREWIGLLGFLASRSLAMADKLIETSLKNAAIEAMQEKIANPIAALAGALVAVGAARDDVDQLWDPWLRNLADWFPGIPDGPIILAHRLLQKARNPEQIAEARKFFCEGLDRGVPCYSMTIEWLANGLASLPGNDSALWDRRRTARRLLRHADLTKAFTVLSVYAE